MPNTLAHLAFHGLVTRGILPKAELPWIYAGCVIPDLPWILQRAIGTLVPEVDAYDLRLYAVNQSSLFVSLVFCAGLAAMAASWQRTFAILGLGCLMHLLLDAFEIKWGNGVSLFVPFDWRLIRFDWVWPGSGLSYGFALCGLIYFIVTLRAAIGEGLRWSRHPVRWALAMTLVLLYFVLPILWSGQALAANNHYVATLLAIDERPGKSIEMDRPQLRNTPDGLVIDTFAGETLHVTGIETEQDANIFVRGEFVSPDIVYVHDYHVHHAGLRDAASYIGLILVAGLWAWCLLGRHLQRFARCSPNALNVLLCLLMEAVISEGL